MDLDEIAQALSDQTDDEHRRMKDPTSRKLHLWISDIGLDGQDDLIGADEFERTDLVPIDPLASCVW